GVGLGLRQTVRITGRSSTRHADQGRGVGTEAASARIIDDAVDDAVTGITGRNRRFGGVGELPIRDGGCRAYVLRMDQIFYGDLAPHLRSGEPLPVYRWRVGQNAVELIAELLCKLVALTTAGRAAVPVVVDG